MQLKILTFGISRDILGGPEYLLDLHQPIRVGALRTELFNRFPELANLRSLAIAVNEEYAEDDRLIEASDEVVLIPPVSGG